MPGVDLTPRPDKSAKLPMLTSMRREGSIDSPDYMPDPTARPMGVGLVAFTSFCIGGFLLLVFTLAFFQPAGVSALAYLSVLAGVIALGLSVALWQLYPWARMMAVAFYGLVAVVTLVTAFLNTFNAAYVVIIVVTAALAIYLLGHRARLAFEEKETI